MPASPHRPPARAALPAISVFLPTAFRFRDGYLARAIDSLLAQDFAQWQLLAVDDGSVDGTREYLADLAARDPRVRHVRIDRNIGLPAFVLSRAWKLARAPLVAWLFDDCELVPDHLSTLKRELDEHPDCGMAYGCARAVLAERAEFVIGQPFDRESAEAGRNVVPNVCAMLRREVIEKVGWFDPHVVMKRICDWDLWVRVAKAYPIRFVDQVLAIEHGTSLAHSLGRMFTQDMDLVLAYSRTDRNSRLHPSRLHEEACYRQDLGFRMTDAHRDSLNRILLEHAFFTANETLALQVAQLMRDRAAAAKPGAPSARRLLIEAGARLLRARAESSARNDIAHETQLRAALAEADARLKTIEALRSATGGARGSNVAMQGLRDLADQRYEMLVSAQDHANEIGKVAQERLAIIEALQERVASNDAAAQRFRALADERFELVGKAQKQAVEAGRVADERLALIGQLHQQLDAAGAAAQKFRAVADERFDQLTKLQGHVAQLQAVAEQRLGLLGEWEARTKAAEEVTQRFRALADERFELVGMAQRQAVDTGRVADERLALIGQLHQQLDAAGAAAQNFRAVADERFDQLTKLQGHVAELQTVAEQRLRLLGEWEARTKAAEEVTQRFRATADQRLAMVHSLQEQLQAAHELGSSLQDELRIAGEQLGDAQRTVEQRGHEIAALAAALDQARAHGDQLARSLEQTNAELTAACFRVDEARRVQHTLVGRLAFWMHRTFGK